MNRMIFLFLRVLSLSMNLGYSLAIQGKANTITFSGFPNRLKLSVSLVTMEISRGLSYSNLSPTVN